MIEQLELAFNKKEPIPLDDRLKDELVYLMAQIIMGYWKTTQGGQTSQDAAARGPANNGWD